jgi:hypothetical protein
MIQLHSPSKVSIQEIAFQAHGDARGISVATEDMVGSRVRISGIDADYNNGLMLLVSGLENASVDLYAWNPGLPNANTGAPTSIQVIGSGDPAARSRVACWGCGGGSGAGGTNVYSSSPYFGVSNHGHLVVEGFYVENSAPLFNLTDSGAAVLLGGTYAVGMSTDEPVMVMNGFTGTVTLANWLFESCCTGAQWGNLSIGQSSSSDVLLLGVNTEDPNAVSTVDFGSTVALRNGYFEDFAAGVSPVPDRGTMTATQMATQLGPVRQNAPSQNTSVPIGISDVQVSRIWANGLTTVFVIEPGT